MLNTTFCSSCGACANSCARNAISMQLNNEGFYRPVVDSEKCVQCGICEEVCPWSNLIENPNGSLVNPSTYAAYTKNQSIRQKSSSGGIFTTLAEKVIEENGVVVGVAQITPTKFGHILAESKDELGKFRGSKYVQADPGLIYRQVRSLLKAGRKVLFSGTPCQVAALYSVLGKTIFPNLITIDIVCHGTPSVKVFEKYITELEKEHSACVLSSCFRDKREGWGMYSMSVSLKTNTGKVFQFSETAKKNKYIRVFLSNLCLNESCFVCHYAKLPRIADVTLGDFWGIERHHPQMYDDKGVSVVLLNTTKGVDIFESVKDMLVFCKSDVHIATSCQRNINGTSIPHRKRKLFFNDLNKCSFSELYLKYCPEPTFIRKICSFARNRLSALKNKILSRNKRI